MQQSGTGDTSAGPWWDALPVLGPLTADYLGGHPRLPGAVRHAGLVMDPRGVGLVRSARLLLGVPWAAVDDIVVEGAGDFARRVSREPHVGLDAEVKTGDRFTYITVSTRDPGVLTLRTTAARPHILRTALRPVLPHFPQRPPPGFESEPATVRIEEIPVFHTAPARPYRAVQPIAGRTHARTAFSPPPSTDDVDMKLREAAARVGANAVVAPTYVRGTMSWRWYPLAAFATAAVIADDGHAGAGAGARPYPIFSPDGAHWWDGRSWRPRPGSPG